MMNMRNLSIILASVFFLGACAETQLLVHTAKRVQRADKPAPLKPAGEYKIGKPYQISGVWYYPEVNYGYAETGVASWYGPKFHGKRTANGEIFDMNDLTAAHGTLPLPSLVQVTNLENGRALKLRVNDRGPFAHGRIIDVSRRGAQLLGFARNGTARVRVEILASGSRLLARNLNSVQIAATKFPVQVGASVSKPMVNTSSLPPPPGAQMVNGTAVAGPVARVAPPPERRLAVPAEPDGVVTQQPVGATVLYVQAGAFSQYANAHRVATRLYGITNIKIISAIVDGKEYFRVRAGPMGTVEGADRALEQMINNGYPNARLIVD